MNKNISNNKALQKAIYERVMTNVMNQLNEEEMNELFGWSKGVEKPSTELTAEYIQSASPEELADTMGAYLNYWADSAKDNLDKALSAAIAPIMSACEGTAENGKAITAAIAAAIRKGLSATGDAVKSLPRLIMMGIALCVKMAANGIAEGKAAALALYNGIVKYAKTTYEACAAKVESGIDAIKEKAILLAKLSMAIFTLVANKVQGAAETCGAWLKEIVAAAKEKATMAVLMVRSWFAVKTREAADAIKEFGADLRDKVVAAYNVIDKKIRKAWNDAVAKILEWCDAVKLTVAKLGEKVKETMTATGDAIISGKDKIVVGGIGKAVKMLSSKYSEDDVVAIVRKAYNEGLTFDAYGRCVINECYYSKTTLNRI